VVIFCQNCEPEQPLTSKELSNIVGVGFGGVLSVLTVKSIKLSTLLTKMANVIAGIGKRGRCRWQKISQLSTFTNAGER
jgi:hypothetical protein